MSCRVIGLHVGVYSPVSSCVCGTVTWGRWTGDERRGLWCMLRVENEIGNNLEGYRSINYVPPLNPTLHQLFQQQYRDDELDTTVVDFQPTRPSRSAPRALPYPCSLSPSLHPDRWAARDAPSGAASF